MSYSFDIRAADKADAKAQVAAKLAQVVQNDPVHARDHDNALAAAGAVIDVLVEDPATVVVVRMNGSLGWRGPMNTPEFTAANLSVSVWLEDKVA